MHHHDINILNPIRIFMKSRDTNSTMNEITCRYRLIVPCTKDLRSRQAQRTSIFRLIIQNG